MYSISCRCGNRIKVELFQAGTSAKCPTCQNTVPIPGSLKLKELSGDLLPHLHPAEKIALAVQTGAPPFHGVCHGCTECNAEYEVPVEFKAVLERHSISDSGILIRPSGLVFQVGATEERHLKVNFPLLLCPKCSRKFRMDYFWSDFWWFIGSVCLWGIGLGFALLVVFVMGNFVRLGFAIQLAVLATVAISIRLAYVHGSRKGNRALIDWLKRIHWVGEMIAVGDESEFTADGIRPWNRPLIKTDGEASAYGT